MKSKLLTRIILVTTVALLIGMIVSIAVFQLITVTTTLENLKHSSRWITQGAKYCEDLDDLIELLEYRDQILYITILDSSNNTIYDSVLEENPDLLNGNLLGDSKYLLKARKEGFSTRIGSPYKNNSTMLMYTITIDDPKFDPNGCILVRSSMPIIFNNEPFWIIFGVGISVWLSIVLAAYLFINTAMKHGIKPIEELEESIKEIADGTYVKREQKPSGDKFMDRMNDNLRTISERITVNMLEAKEAQTKSKFLLESVSMGIMALTKIGTIMFHNHTMLELLDGNDIDGMSLDFVVKDDLLDIINKGFNAGAYTFGTYHNHNNVFRVECIPVDSGDDEDSTRIVMLVIASNITQEYETARIRNEFFANASHELKTPLTAISGYSELITLGNQKEETITKCASEINSNAQKMKKLINDMLRLSRYDARLNVEDESRFDLYDVVESVVESQSVIAKTKQVTLSFNGEKDNIIFARKEMIKLVVENLVNNAIKYNKVDGTVDVSLYKEGRFIILKVKDTGIGIAKEHQGRLFERFYKVDNARTRTEESSTGLGLAIVKQIILMHKAQIQVESKEGIGTTMTVRFQLPKEESDN